MKLGRYEIVRELGKGAMGIVYLAKDPVIGRMVALKTIRIAGNTDDEEAKEFQQRFVREAQAAGILNHPSIVTVHDIGQAEDGTSFIAMEFVEGQNLKEVLTQGRPLSFDQLGDIIAQVAEGLDFAHAKGIVHRDVKPANIIVLDGNRAKITDFGIAKIAEGGANLTSTGQFLGTPNYMAPEQVKGAPVDGRTDIFSLGICLYECLTRRKPFGGDSLTSISYKIVHEPFPPLQELNPQIPEGYEAVVAGCLAKEPARRYQRARDVANAIRAVIRGEKPSSLSDVTSVEETMITRDQKLPTMDVPFPEATAARSLGSGLSATSAGSAAVGSGTLVGKVAQEGTEAARLIMTGVTRLTSMPIWRRRLPPALFFGVIGVLAAMLLGAVTVLRGAQAEVPAIDTAAESRRAREKTLRLEANTLLRQGRVVDAYAKFYELQRLAPNSPYVQDNLQKLGAIQQQEEISKQQLAEADLMFQEGVVLLDQRNYDGAIELFEEALRLNPNYVAATEHLEFALSEQQRIEGAAAANRRNLDLEQQSVDGSADTRGSRAATTRASGSRTTAAPVQLTTTFSHPFTEGQLVVRVGGDVLLNELLFEERQARAFRRTSRVAREINIARTFPAKNADVQVWVTVPGSNIQEHHTIEAVRFEAGGSHQLIVRFDPGSRRFSYELN